MKTTGRLVLIWMIAGLVLLIGIGLLVWMLFPGQNIVVTPTPNAFEAGASVTVTRFVLPPTWTVAPPQQTDLPHPTANRLPTLTPATLVMPTLAITFHVIPSQTQGPTQTMMPTTTHIPLNIYTATNIPTAKATATKKP